MTFTFDVDFVADNDSFADDPQTVRVVADANDAVDAQLAAVQMVGATRGVPVAARQVQWGPA